MEITGDSGAIEKVETGDSRNCETGDTIPSESVKTCPTTFTPPKKSVFIYGNKIRVYSSAEGETSPRAGVHLWLISLCLSAVALAKADAFCAFLWLLFSA